MRALKAVHKSFLKFSFLRLRRLKLSIEGEYELKKVLRFSGWLNLLPLFTVVYSDLRFIKITGVHIPMSQTSAFSTIDESFTPWFFSWCWQPV